MYRLYSFDGVTLPDARSDFDAATAQAWNGALALPGGSSAFDSHGSGRAPLVAPYMLQYSSVVSASSLSALETAMAAWRTKVGVRGTLRRRLLSGATYHDITARLVDVQMNVKPAATHGKMVPMQWRWQVLEEFWRASSVTSSPFTLSTAPYACAIVNSGSAVIRDVLIAFMPAVSEFTVIDVAISGVAHWTYTGSIDIGDQLFVDCGSRRVYNKANTDLYSGFELESNHASDDWLPLAASATTTINVTRTGGSAASTVNFDYYIKHV